MTTSNAPSNLPVKRISDFDSQTAHLSIIKRPYFFFGLVLTLAAFGVFLPPYLAVKWQDEGFLWVGLAFLVVTIFALIQREIVTINVREGRKERYELYLKSVSPDLLKAVATSPEYDQASREAVIKYLSANHAGWSLVPELRSTRL